MGITPGTYSAISGDTLDTDVREYTIDDDTNTYNETGTTVSPIIQFFEAEHLSAPLRPLAQDFARFAKSIDAQLPRTAEKTVALRKLLEGKDAAIRASLELLD